MKASAVNPETGKVATVELTLEEVSALEALSTTTSSAVLQSHIDNLSVSADVKMFLGNVSEAIVRVGELVIHLGKKILEAVLFIHSRYPSTSIGLLLGLLMGVLASTIPLLGWLLGPLVGLVASLFGVVVGSLDDLKDREIARQIELIRAEFDVLKGELNVTQ